MGKWHSIAAKKAAGDLEKARNYSKIWKIIQLVAKWWADPSESCFRISFTKG